VKCQNIIVPVVGIDGWTGSLGNYVISPVQVIFHSRGGPVVDNVSSECEPSRSDEVDEASVVTRWNIEQSSPFLPFFPFSIFI
jgi:hypothetical protein